MSSYELQFIINEPSPAGAGGPTKKRSVVHSHAARAAHAKTRRLRTLQYQAQKLLQEKKEQDDTATNNQLNGPGPGPLISLLPADRRDPFASLVVGLKPLEQLLFDHYVTAIIPRMRCRETDDWFCGRMTRIWVPHALAEESLLSVMFLASCRHLSLSYQPEEAQKERGEFFARLALQYKLKSLRYLRQAIELEAPVFTDSTIATPIMLSYDELFVCDERMLRHHVEGVVRMVGINGGPQTLGMEGLLARLLSNILAKVTGEVGMVVRLPWETQVSGG